jgi:hypothetical protein
VLLEVGNRAYDAPAPRPLFILLRLCISGHARLGECMAKVAAANALRAQLQLIDLIEGFP